jgi:hypothetical protein
MFSSRLLNSLVHTHPAVPLVLWGPVILAMAVSGIRQVGSLVASGLMAAAYLLWTLEEVAVRAGAPVSALIRGWAAGIGQ